MQRVLVITGWYPSIREPNNGDFVKEQVRLLRQEGLSIDVIYADLNIAYLLDGRSNRRTQTNLCKDRNREVIVSGPFWPKNQTWGLNQWIQQYAMIVIQQLKRDSLFGIPNIIHAHTYLGGAVASMIKRKQGIPYIITEHYTGWIDGSIKKFHKKIGQDAFDNAESIWAVSPSLCRSLQRETFSPVGTLPNFIDTSFFHPNSRMKDPEFHYIGVGDLIKRKKWEDLVVAFSKLITSHPSSKLTIAGDGYLKNNLIKRIKDLQLESKISLVGHLPKDRLLQLYQSAHVLVHTSKTETFGLSMIEGMSCGLPIISYPHPTSSFIINKSTLGLVTDNYNTAALSNAMRAVQDNYSNYNSETIRDSIVQRFGPGKVAQKLKTIYSEAMQG